MIKNFLKELQSASEDRKGKWLVASTVVIMIGVVYIWLAYFNGLISSATKPQAIVVRGGEEFSLWQTMKGGTAIVYEGVINIIKSAGGILGSSRDYIIKP